jgi:hypothetical protein
MTRNIAQLLKEGGMIEDYQETGEGMPGELVITLKYQDGNLQPIIKPLERMGRPGLRVHSQKRVSPYRNYRITPLKKSPRLDIIQDELKAQDPKIRREAVYKLEKIIEDNTELKS